VVKYMTPLAKVFDGWNKKYGAQAGQSFLSGTQADNDCRRDPLMQYLTLACTRLPRDLPANSHLPPGIHRFLYDGVYLLKDSNPKMQDWNVRRKYEVDALLYHIGPCLRAGPDCSKGRMRAIIFADICALASRGLIT